MNPSKLNCKNLKDKKYKELCLRLQRKEYNKNFSGTIGEYYFPELNKYFSPMPVKINKDGFTSNKDIDELILNKMEDEDLINACVINKYIYSLCQADSFWLNRYILKYGNYIDLVDSDGDLVTELKKWKGDASWKEFYLWTSDLINSPNPYFIFSNAIAAERFDIAGILFGMKNVITIYSESPYLDGVIKFYVRAPKGFDPRKPYDSEKLAADLSFPKDAEGLATFIGGDGRIRKTYFLNGLEEGESVSYYPNGQISEIINYHNGVKKGKEIIYNQGGLKIKEIMH